MPFRPNANDILPIDGVPYRVAEHPAAPGMPYGQEGRAATVYELVAGYDRRAMKVFKPRFRVPALVGISKRLAQYAELPGLQVCRRIVLLPQQHATLLRENPDLLYAVVMPWIDGPTWMEVLIAQREITREQSLTVARSLSTILTGMEQYTLAHCDLSGSNMIVPALATPPAASPTPVALVDLEQMYGPGLETPEIVPGGSQGYAHNTAPKGLWEATADRFAGAVLLAEMLTWCDSRIRKAAWGESYFAPDEMQQDTEHYRLMMAVLTELWGENVAALLERAWHSGTLDECAVFSEWLLALPDTTEEAQPGTAPALVPTPAASASASQQEQDRDSLVKSLMSDASDLEELGKRAAALAVYREALSTAVPGSALARELAIIVDGLARTSAPTHPLQPVESAPPVPPEAPPTHTPSDRAPEPEPAPAQPPMDLAAALAEAEMAAAALPASAARDREQPEAEAVTPSPAAEPERPAAVVAEAQTEAAPVPSLGDLLAAPVETPAAGQPESQVTPTGPQPVPEHTRHEPAAAPEARSEPQPQPQAPLVPPWQPQPQVPQAMPSPQMGQGAAAGPGPGQAQPGQRPPGQPPQQTYPPVQPGYPQQGYPPAPQGQGQGQAQGQKPPPYYGQPPQSGAWGQTPAPAPQPQGQGQYGYPYPQQQQQQQQQAAPAAPARGQPKAATGAAKGKGKAFSPVWAVGGLLALVLVVALAWFLIAPRLGSSTGSGGSPTNTAVLASAAGTATATSAISGSAGTPVSAASPTTVAAAAPTDTAAPPAPTDTAAPPTATPLAAPSPALCFGNQACIGGRLFDTWQQLGGKSADQPGLAGLPLGNAQVSNNTLVQRFERYMMVFQPGKQPPADIQFANLGVDNYRKYHGGKDAPPAKAIEGCIFFPETNHNVCEDFYKLWIEKGPQLGIKGDARQVAISLFGLPISEDEFDVPINGEKLSVQWFERARFEFHPNNPPETRYIPAKIGTEAGP